MTQLEKAVIYIRQNTSLSFHHVAVKFGVNVSELQNTYKTLLKV